MNLSTDYLPVPGEEIETPKLPIISIGELLKVKMERPAELVAGVLHKGSKLVLGSNSKGCKTWTLIDLGLSIAACEPWLSFKTVRGRVLFLNFEVQTVFFRDRIEAVAKEKRIKLDGLTFDLLNMRERMSNPKELLVTLANQIKAENYALIILDPIYKMYEGADENSAGDIAKVLHKIEMLAVETGAAVAFSAHFSKGNQASKEAIDRISGSGVFARDPDSILMLTKHQEDNAFVVESILRNFKPLDAFSVRWQWPLMRRDDSLDPTKLKQPANKNRKYNEKQLLQVLGNKKLTTVQWCKTAEKETGMSKRTFYALHTDVCKQPNVKQTPKGQWFIEEKSE